MEIKNAQVKGAQIFIERGMLTMFLNLECEEGGTQAFGGYLYSPSFNSDTAGFFLYRILQVVGVEDLSQVKDKIIRIKREKGGRGLITAIGHPLKEIWFNPKEDLVNRNAGPIPPGTGLEETNNAGHQRDLDGSISAKESKSADQGPH